MEVDSEDQRADRSCVDLYTDPEVRAEVEVGSPGVGHVAREPAEATADGDVRTGATGAERKLETEGIHADSVGRGFGREARRIQQLPTRSEIELRRDEGSYVALRALSGT